MYHSNLKGKHTKESQRNITRFVSSSPRRKKKTFQTDFRAKIKIYLKRITKHFNVEIFRQKDPIFCALFLKNTFSFSARLIYLHKKILCVFKLLHFECKCCNTVKSDRNKYSFLLPSWGNIAFVLICYEIFLFKNTSMIADTAWITELIKHNWKIQTRLTLIEYK